MKNAHEESLDDLKRRNPIDAILAERGYLPVKLAGRQQVYSSPLREEGHPSFYVDAKKGPGGVFYDFGAGVGGDVITLVEQLEGMSTGEAIRYLRERRP